MPTRRVGLTGCCVVLRPHGCCGRRVCCPAGRAAWCAGGRRSFCVVCCPDRFPTAARPARPRAVRAASFARRVGSKPGQALQASRRPPIGRGACVLSGQAPQASRCPPHRRGLSLCVVRPGPAAHGHRCLAPSIPQDSHPVVTSHIPEPTPNFACNSPESILRFELWALELQRFHTLLKLHPIELHASFLGSGRIGACWWRSWSPRARCAVVWNRRRLCLLVPVWG